MKNYRVGLGFDVHKFSNKKRELKLGGAIISSPVSLEAVSDGDVLLHAVCDAICGACLLGDIGDHFPPCSKDSKNIDSKKIVKFVLKKISKKFKIVNIDITLISEKPKLVSYKKKITNSLKAIFAMKEINLKIKSKEGLDILGSRKAMSCFALALIEKI
ncbi:MAG: 2-C-methyl-D-erythritol 2,4-cyclodiphosphate synthase [Candidatus Omnitrophota bacterium]|jgi:2-C-methyl-D-erythritol 2,4-cyclodiphosphate synthase